MSLSLLSRKGADPNVVSKVPLIPVNCSFGIVTELPAKKKSLREAVIKERKKLGCRDVMIVFAIRRPGCGACRENGRIISELAEEENVGCLGIIKHINVDNNALMDFYQEYFRHPIYKDEQWKVYHALGNRKIAAWKYIAFLPKLTIRYRRKKIENVPFGGDLFTQGGVLVFDKEGNLRFTYHERYGEPFDVKLLKDAIDFARNKAPGSDDDRCSLTERSI